ncbi:chaplin [Streptomyces sp. NPDC059517]|uniref:chaplin n=1 Tax=Streptomyces sp. NPDC059517 TaxID=3346855 RepID=UPI0036C96FFF
MSRLFKSASLLVAMGAAVLGGAGAAQADSGAEAVAAHSPGVLSGNVIQVPIHVPVNVCGNTVSVIGLLNPAFGNTCVNSSHHGGMWK